MPLFDPTTGKVLDREALESIQVRAGGFRQPKVAEDRAADTKTVEAIHEGTGRTAGFHTFHGDGRVDATATPEPVVVTQEG